MDYQTLELLRRSHPAWKLLAADHAPLIASFLHRTFIEPNVRSLSQAELTSRLDDHLFDLRERLGLQAFPKTAAQYLDDWAADAHGWLRRYYPGSSDEPHFDLTPATERALDWLWGLRRQEFISTESRLRTVFDLLHQMTEGTEVDPAVRLADLARRKAQIEAEIRSVEDGRVTLMGPSQIKDRFLQMASTARALLHDFREVELNFRDLDRHVRERIATWEGGKGALLEQIFGERDAISDSDQGKSFRAFWDFLMSPARQEELSLLLEAVFAMKPVQELSPDPRLKRIHFDWLEAGEVAQRTIARLSEQLRRYLDEQVFLENRRLMQLIRSVEQHALAMRSSAPEGTFMEVDEPAPEIDLTMDRPLFTPPLKPKITDQILLDGEQAALADALFEQVYVDRARLATANRRALQIRPQISLFDLVETAPLEQGLAEVVAYLSLAAEDPRAVIDERRTQTLLWEDPEGAQRQATLPLVIFTR